MKPGAHSSGTRRGERISELGLIFLCRVHFKSEDDVALVGYCSGGVRCRAWTAGAAAFEAAAAANATQTESDEGAAAAGVGGAENSGW